MEDKMQNRGH